MASYMKAFVPFVVLINLLTFLFVWQIYDNVLVIEEKVQKLLIDKEIAQVSIETDFDKRQSDLLKDLAKSNNIKGQNGILSNANKAGRLRFDTGGAGPQRVAIARLREVNAWLDPGHSSRQRRTALEDNVAANEDTDHAIHTVVGETQGNAFKVVKMGNNFKVIKVEDETIAKSKNNLNSQNKHQITGAASNTNNNSQSSTSSRKKDQITSNNALDLDIAADTYLPRLDGENIVSMSLWGRNRRYTAGALRNAELVQRYFPGWKIRIYTETTHDNQMFESIPENIVSDLRKLGVEFEFMDPSDSKVPPMMWRFLVADDLSVDRFIIRDSDSRLNARDAAAVWAWEQSGKAFHCIRDHPSHANYAVSGGMWGGRPAALRNILRKSWRDIMYGYRSNYLTDMTFLQDVIWPRVRAHAYCSDSVSCDKWPSSHPYPIRRIGYEHVGQVYAPNELSRPEDIAILRQTRDNVKCVPP